MADKTLDIQQLVTASGVPRRTIYFYVQQGVLPPPNGAGLAAHYTDDHLMRLRLIPVMRQQGLRLDEIRERFTKMSEDEMRGLLQAAEQQPTLHRPAAQATPPSEPVRALPGLPPVMPPQGWDAQRYTHYTFPGGITLSVPENLSALDRQRLDQLLQAARRIFFSWNRMVSFSDPDPSRNENTPEDHSDQDSSSPSDESSNGKPSL